MFGVTKDRPLATTITGSLPRPGWYTANLRGRAFPVAMADFTFPGAVYTDVLAALLCDQERAGLDLLTDATRAATTTSRGARGSATSPSA